jgi:oligoendopeptidase F
MTTATAPTSNQTLGDLPRWDLTDLYPGPDSPALAADLAAARAGAERLRSRLHGRMDSLDGAALAVAIAEYEAIDERLARAMSYAQLIHASAVDDAEVGRFHQSTHEAVTEISALTLFFTLELNALDDAAIAPKLAHPDMTRWRPWVRDLRVFKPHQLDDAMERLLHEKQVAGRAAWTRLFDETMAAIRVPLDGQDLTVTEVLHKVQEPDADLRRRAALAFSGALDQRVKLFALVTNTLAKDKEIEDRWRKHARPISARNRANRVEDEVVDALIHAVREAFPATSHRYYRLKAAWFGQPRLAWWDRNAPPPDAPDRVIAWAEARDIVLGAWTRFSPTMADLGRRFFDNRWIDAPSRAGKSSGAFAHPTVPGAHPYLLLNYMGRVRDVMTLAHELGHGVHQVLAAGQGHLLADTPLTLAETASVFGEMLTFKALLASETDPRRRRVMLAGKIEDMLNTVVRQIALHGFEARVHDARREAELTPDALGRIWLEVQGDCLGPAIRLDEDYRHWWAYIPHFVHSPFYVYAYAFGDCLVNSLYAVYEGAEAGFAEKYLDMLRAGGTRRHGELLAPFGLDARDPAFWSRGLGVVERMIDEFESLA